MADRAGTGGYRSRVAGSAAAVPSAGRVVAGRAVSIAAVAAGIWYLVWRLDTLAGTGPLGIAFYAAECATFALLVASAALVARGRWRRSGTEEPPRGSLDVFVTVCGEPVEIVAETIRAALAIDYPHTTYVLNDGRRAGLPDWQRIDELAAELGVACFTRTSGPRGKAANLNHALRRTSGDFVVTIDADHAARQDLADRTLGYFADGRVGFICTRQAFDGGRADVLNNEERFFYDFLQPAKEADAAAFSCGNGTLYRRSALASIGGFSEWNLVEDLHTSYELHAAGWRSVYHPYPVTFGSAPKTPAVFLRQRMRWATDSLRLLFWDSPLWKRGLTAMQRVHYLHTTSYYLLTSLQLLLLAGPPLYIFGQISVVNASSLEAYLRHAVPYLAGILAFLAVHGGLRGALRIMQSTLFSSFAYLLATVLAALRIPPDSSPTEKGRQRWFSSLVVPPLVLYVAFIAAIVFAAFADGAGRSPVALAWAAFMGFLLTGPLTALADRALLERVMRTVARTAIVATAGLLVTLDLASAPSDAAAADACAPPYAALDAKAATRFRLDPPVRGAYLGVTEAGLPGCPGSVERWNRVLGRDVGIVHWYQQWRSGETRFPGLLARRASEAGAVPMVSWEPWAKPRGRYAAPEQREVRLERIVAGDFDAYVRAWARQAAAYGEPLLLRPMHEMNGTWYPWSIETNGNTPAQFVAAWRHLHAIFREEGATNVSWVWSVNTFAGLVGDNRNLASYYPGDAYVDWVGMSGFNWGTATSWGAWRGPRNILRETYEALVRFGKPVMVAEIGTVRVGGDPARWIRRTVRVLEREFPEIRAVVWFSRRYTAHADFRLEGRTLAALRSSVARSPHWADAATVRVTG